LEFEIRVPCVPVRACKLNEHFLKDSGIIGEKEKCMDTQDKPKENFGCIFRTPYKSQISIIESLLISNKITYYIENYNFASLGSFDGSINFGVMVQQDSVIEAKALLKDIIYPTPSEGSESVQFEVQRKFREKHPRLSLLSGLFGVIVGFIFILLGIIVIKVPFSFKGAEEISLKVLFVSLLCVLGFLIAYAGHKELKSTLKVINNKKRQPAPK
jgi:hypothetical protein